MHRIHSNRAAALAMSLVIATAFLGLVYLVPAAAHPATVAGGQSRLATGNQVGGHSVLSSTQVYLPLISTPQLTRVVYTLTLDVFSTLGSLEPTLEEAIAGPHVTCDWKTCPYIPLEPTIYGDGFAYLGSSESTIHHGRWSVSRMLLKINPDIVPANVQVDRVQLHLSDWSNGQITVTMHIGTWTGYGPESWNSYLPEPVMVITRNLPSGIFGIDVLRPVETWQAIRNSGGRLFFKTAEVDDSITGVLEDGLFISRIQHDMLDNVDSPSYFRVYGWIPAIQ